MRRSARLSSSTNTEPTQPDWPSGTVQGEGCGTTCLRLRGDTDFGKAPAVDFARLGNHTTRLCESMDFVFRHLRFWCTAETCPGAAYLMHKRGEWTAPFWNKDNAGASGFDLLLRAVVILKTQNKKSSFLWWDAYVDAFVLARSQDKENRNWQNVTTNSPL